jgi:hypothetical protein
MKKINTAAIIFAVSIFAVMTALTSNAGAKLTDVKKIPNGKKNSCENCHQPGTESKDKLTPFGNDYNANGKKWNDALAKKDSDGDKMTNGQELGDPAGSWKKGDSDPSGPVFNPGNASSHK